MIISQDGEIVGPHGNGNQNNVISTTFLKNISSDSFYLAYVWENSDAVQIFKEKYLIAV